MGLNTRAGLHWFYYWVRLGLVDSTQPRTFAATFPRSADWATPDYTSPRHLKATPHSAGRPAGLPLVFFHGLGHGLVFYLNTFKHLTRHTLFLIELPHVSTRIWEHIPSPSHTVAAVECILQSTTTTEASSSATRTAPSAPRGASRSGLRWCTRCC